MSVNDFIIEPPLSLGAAVVAPVLIIRGLDESFWRLKFLNNNFIKDVVCLVVVVVICLIFTIMLAKATDNTKAIRGISNTKGVVFDIDSIK